MKLIRTLLVGEVARDSSGLGEGGTDCSGEVDGDSPIVGEGVGEGDSCPSAKQGKMAIVNARMAVVVMSSGVETSLTV
jgi:hypothetical protein